MSVACKRGPSQIATDMHVLGGYHEIQQLDWHEQTRTVSGSCRRMPGVSGRLYFYVPTGYEPQSNPTDAPAYRLTHADGPLWTAELQFGKADMEFNVSFD